MNYKGVDSDEGNDHAHHSLELCISVLQLRQDSSPPSHPEEPSQHSLPANVFYVNVVYIATPMTWTGFGKYMSRYYRATKYRLNPKGLKFHGEACPHNPYLPSLKL